MSTPPEQHVGAAFGTQPESFGTASGPRAGFWRRFAGALVDALILSIPELLLAAVLKGAGSFIALALSAAYFTIFIGSARGQTPGQSALGIRVIGLQDGAPIGNSRAFIRWLSSILSSIPLALGYFWMLWDREKQCWHDKFANCIVVPVGAYPPPPR